MDNTELLERCKKEIIAANNNLLTAMRFADGMDVEQYKSPEHEALILDIDKAIAEGEQAKNADHLKAENWTAQK
jgi:hypothetical protein